MTFEKKPEGVREELWNDWNESCKLLTQNISSVEKRGAEVAQGVFFFLEGKRYEISCSPNLKVLWIESAKTDFHALNLSRVIRETEMRRGVPIIDIEQLQNAIDEMSVEELMRE